MRTLEEMHKKESGRPSTIETYSKELREAVEERTGRSGRGTEKTFLRAQKKRQRHSRYARIS